MSQDKNASLGEYTINKLKAARRLIEEEYVYHYGDPALKSEINRLETILAKLDYLINKEENNG